MKLKTKANTTNTIKGPNWYIVPPSQEELDKANNCAKFHIQEQKECIYCKSLFYYGRSNQNSCSLCKIHVNSCIYCNKSFEVLLNANYSGISGTAFNELREIIFEKKEYHRFCSQKCLSNNNSDKWRKSEKFQKFIRSNEFHTDIAKKLAAERLKKYINSKEGQKHIKEHVNQIAPQLKFCSKCNQMTMH